MNGLCKVVPHAKEQVRTQTGWGITQHMHSELEAVNVHLHSYGKSALQTARRRRVREEPLNPVNSQSGRVKTSKLCLTHGPLGIFLETIQLLRLFSFLFMSFHKWDVQAEECKLSGWGGGVEGGPGMTNVEHYKSDVSLIQHFN